MNNKTNLLEDYVNFVDSTKKRNKYYKIFCVIVIIMFLFSFLASFKYLTQ